MKRFSKLAIPYIVWAALMLILPMALIAMYSVMEPGNSIVSFSLTLDHCQVFYGSGFPFDFMAISCHCG